MLSVSLIVPCHHTCQLAYLCTLHLVLYVSNLKKKKKKQNKNKKNKKQKKQQQQQTISCGKSSSLVTGRSLFKSPLSQTNFLSTSDTAVPSHNSKLLLKSSSSLLPSLSCLVPPEDFCFHRLLLSVLLFFQ